MNINHPESWKINFQKLEYENYNNKENYIQPTIKVVSI